MEFQIFVVSDSGNGLLPISTKQLTKPTLAHCHLQDTWILFKISLEFVPKGPINDIPALV